MQKRDINNKKELYLVVETKGYDNLDEVSYREKIQIASAKPKSIVIIYPINLLTKKGITQRETPTIIL